MAPASLRLVKTQEWSECLICKKPLGADSKSEGFMFCHEHRICTHSDCGEPISAEEARWCLRRFEEEHEVDFNAGETNYIGIEIIHAKCLDIANFKKRSGTITDDPIHTIRQSELDFLNLIRLMVIPDKGLSQSTNEKNSQYAASRLLQTMDFEEKSLFQKKFEAYLELTQDTVRRDPSYRKEFLAEREKERFDKAKKEAVTSSRPVSKKATDTEEVQLAAFVELNNLDPKNREQNKKNMKLYWKTIKDLQFKKDGRPTGISEQQAIDMCKGFLAKLRLDNDKENKENNGMEEKQ